MALGRKSLGEVWAVKEVVKLQGQGLEGVIFIGLCVSGMMIEFGGEGNSLN